MDFKCKTYACDEIITLNNIDGLSTYVTVNCIKSWMRFSRSDFYFNLYDNLFRDMRCKKDYRHIFSSAYDIVMDADCFLSSHNLIKTPLKTKSPYDFHRRYLSATPSRTNSLIPLIYLVVILSQKNRCKNQAKSNFFAYSPDNRQQQFFHRSITRAHLADISEIHTLYCF